MFLEGGVAYVYLCYGIFNLFNVVADHEGIPSAVLIRAGIGCENHATILERRNGKDDLVGPGKLGQAIAATREMSGRSLFKDDFCIKTGQTPRGIRTAPRVGIDYAAAHDRDAHLRFIAQGF